MVNFRVAWRTRGRNQYADDRRRAAAVAVLRGTIPSAIPLHVTLSLGIVAVETSFCVAYDAWATCVEYPHSISKCPRMAPRTVV